MKTITSHILMLRGEELQKAGIAVETIAKLLSENDVEKAFLGDGGEGQPFLNGYTEGGLIAALEVVGRVVAAIGDHLAKAGEEVQP